MKLLKTMIYTACAVFALLGAATASAQTPEEEPGFSISETHEVYVYKKGYFPTTQWVKVNDIVRFVNKTGSSIRIPIVGFGNFTDSIANGASAEITFSYGIDRGIAYPTIGSNSTSDTARAWVRYGEAPLEDATFN